MSPLDFDFLRSQNVARCEDVFHSLHRWNPLEWAGALAGEAGEAANEAKKLRRLDDADRSLDTEKQRQEHIDRFVEELADVVIYADLAAARVGQDLGAAVVAKFNKVSEKRGSRVRL